MCRVLKPATGLYLLGITGPIGCGKSTVSAMTRELGALEVIDADRVTRELMGPGSELSLLIGDTFGFQALLDDKAVDRSHLANIVFNDPMKLRQLEALVHPRVRHVIDSRLTELRKSGACGVVTVEAIRLLDTPYGKNAKAVWVVTCDPSIQMQRLVESRGYGIAEARNRVSAQPLFDSPLVTSRIANDGSLDMLRHTVRKEWQPIITHLEH